MSKQKTVTITFDDEGDKLSLEGIPAEIWERFKQNAQADFPKAGDEAWAHYLSEIIMGVAGGTRNTKTVFMTDVPAANVEALDAVLSQTGRRWDEFHAYLLQAAVIPNAIRLINMVEPGKAHLGTFIATGLNTELFDYFQKAAGHPIEDVLAAIFDAAMHRGEITFTGSIPTYAEKPG